MKIIPIAAVLVALGPSAAGALAQQAKPPAEAAAPAAKTLSPEQKTIEQYLRKLYALGPEVQVSVAPLTPSPVEGLLQTNIEVLMGDNKQEGQFYVSQDGKYLVRGEVSDLTKDPLAAARAQMDLKGAPAIGDPNTPVTLVEYADFECPVCRNLHDVLRTVLPKYAGKVRLVFKDFPIEQLHPWARTAAIAGRCAYQQDPNAFWKMYDMIYGNQAVISPENVWSELLDYANRAGLNVDSFKSCMASPQPAAEIEASRANGQLLEVTSTPTLFVNGRRMVGADPQVLEQYINYELAELKPAKTVAKKESVPAGKTHLESQKPN